MARNRDSHDTPPTGLVRLRWLYQINLRNLLLLLMAASTVLAAYHWKLEAHRKQVAALKQVSDHAQFVKTWEANPAWLRPWADPKIFVDVRHLSFHGNQKFGDPQLVHLRKMPRLNRLSLDSTAVTDQGLAHLERLELMHTLSLKKTRISDQGLAALRNMRWMHKLQLSQTQVTGAGLAQLSGMRNLETLELMALEVQDQHLAHFALFPHLKQLDLRDTRLVSPPASAWQPLQELTEFHVTSRVLREWHLRGLAGLESLEVTGFQLERARLEDLPRLKELKIRVRPHGARLHLENTPQLSTLSVNRHPYASVVIRDVPRLQSLSIRLAVDADADFAAGNLKQLTLVLPTLAALPDLRGVPQIVSLRLRLPFFSDKDQAAHADPAGDASALQQSGLSELPLERLTIHGPVSDAVCAEIAKVSSLRAITLYEPQTELTDRGLAFFADLPELESLHVAGAARVTGQFLSHFGAESPLASLDLYACPGINDQQLESVPRFPTELTHCWIREAGSLDGILGRLISETKVTSLDLMGTPLGAEGLRALATAQRLRELRLGGLGVPAAEQIARLREALPNTTIECLNARRGTFAPPVLLRSIKIRPSEIRPEIREE